MNRTRNIALWIVTALFFLGLMFVVGVLNLWVGIGCGVAALMVFVLLLRFKPKLLGLQREEEKREQEQMVLPEVFSTEIRLVSTGLSKPIRILIDRQDYMIGRSEECDCVIDGAASKRISRRHVRIHYDPEKRAYSVIAFPTPNGTRLNHAQLQPDRKYVIKNGDLLELADVSFKVESAYY